MLLIISMMSLGANIFLKNPLLTVMIMSQLSSCKFFQWILNKHLPILATEIGSLQNRVM